MATGARCERIHFLARSAVVRLSRWQSVRVPTLSKTARCERSHRAFVAIHARNGGGMAGNSRRECSCRGYAAIGGRVQGLPAASPAQMSGCLSLVLTGQPLRLLTSGIRRHFVRAFPACKRWLPAPRRTGEGAPLALIHPLAFGARTRPCRESGSACNRGRPSAGGMGGENVYAPLSPPLR